MSLRNNRATRLNRIMMFGTFFLGIIVLGCVFGFLYLSYNQNDNPLVQPKEDGQAADSIILIVNDSSVIRSE